ncbi:methyltransferase [Nonomuraea sp. NBC_00507]|uniref:methyltransferase n=1 Tax=Nonomuraea sp. NBC_00507 TaxID=2976002 RepID=UPI002E176A62
MSASGEPVWEAIYALSRFAALAAVAELGCADHLVDGPRGVDELADLCGADAPSLRRALREVASMGIVHSTPDGYELTEHGMTLRSGAPGSLRPVVRVIAQEGLWYAIGALTRTVRTGRSAFAERYGSFYDYLDRDPALRTLFDEYMIARTRPCIGTMAQSYDFSRFHTLVDVGGGRGHLLAAVLAGHPRLKGVLLDLDHVVPGAAHALGERGVADRCRLVAGDFFEGVPPGADAYLLANVLHNWSDEDAVRILRNVRSAMSPGGTLFVLEMVLPDDDAPHPGKDMDIRMLALFDGGMERTRQEYTTLLRAVGFRFAEIIPLPGSFDLIVADGA